MQDQDKAIANMLDEIRKVDDDVRAADPPTNDWLDDWDALIDAREAFAEQRANGYEADLRIPRMPRTATRSTSAWTRCGLTDDGVPGARGAAQSLSGGRLGGLSCRSSLLLGDLLERPHLGSDSASTTSATER